VENERIDRFPSSVVDAKCSDVDRHLYQTLEHDMLDLQMMKLLLKLTEIATTEDISPPKGGVLGIVFN